MANTPGPWREIERLFGLTMWRLFPGMLFALTVVAGSEARAQSFDDPFPLLPRARALALESLPGAWLWRIESITEAIEVEPPCQQAAWRFRFRHPDDNRIVSIQARPVANHGRPCTRWHFLLQSLEAGESGQSWGPLEIPEQRAPFTAVVTRAKKALGSDGQMIQMSISLEMAEAAQESRIYAIDGYRCGKWASLVIGIVSGRLDAGRSHIPHCDRLSRIAP